MWRSRCFGLPYLSFPCSVMIAFLAMAWAAVPSAGADAVEEKLLHAEGIIGPFEAGHETVRVIVNLVKPPAEAQTAGADSLEAQSVSRQVSVLKTYVLSTLPMRDVKLRHRFADLSAFSAEVTPEGLAALLNEPLVESVEPVEYYWPHVAQGIPLMKADVYRSTYNGQGTAIAIIDSGIDYTHPQLGGGQFPNNKVIGGYDTGEEDGDPFPMMSNGDSSGEHGTACAGIAAGNTGGPSPYIGGVAPGAKLYAFKNIELDKDGRQIIRGDNTIEAILWCIQHKNDDPNNPIVVISISQGGSTGYSAACDETATRAEADACRKAVEAGITVISSSGNGGLCNGITPPACYSNVISVGAVYDADLGRQPREGYVGCLPPESCAGYTQGCGCGRCWVEETTKADQVPIFSNTASFLTLLAPANKAYTTDIVGPKGYNSGNYHDDFGGTSAACPYAAGAVACLQSAAKAVKGQYLTPAQVKTILTSTGDPVTDRKMSPAITKPRINVAKAIESLAPDRKTTTVFADAFVSHRIDADKWVQYLGVTIDDEGLAEPSPDLSLRLNGHPLGGDYVISQTIDLSHYDGATLGYWYQRTGGGDPPGPDHDLIFEYDAGAGWRELSRQRGNGPDMDGYERVSVTLPAEAMGATFRLQIRSVGLATALNVRDDWFVDDVAIDAWTKPPEVIVFEDAFASTTLDTDKWVQRVGATVDSVGLNEPSPEYSLRLNNSPGAHDRVSSVAMDLSSYSRVTLSYWYERTGGGQICDEGEDLIIEYDSGAGWRELRRHRGGEPDMAQYEQVTIELPAEAMTANFRLQIRSTGHAVSALPFYDWFVDDVKITGFSKP
jgi:subtilisin family serine protease